MKRISLIFQELLKFLLIFVVMFVWTRYLFRNFWASLTLSISISAILYFALYVFKSKKQKANGLKIKEKEEAENMFFSLACDDKAMDFFCKLASKKHSNIEKHKEYLTISCTDSKAKTLLWFEKSFDGLNISRFMEIYNKIKKEKATKIVLLCKEISDKQLSIFVKNFNEKFLILDQYNTYEKLYKFYNFFPQISLQFKKQNKMAFKDFLSVSFNKKKTKAYLFSALVIVLSSFFVRTTIYYCILSSILVIFAIISQFNPYFNLKNETEIL